MRKGIHKRYWILGILPGNWENVSWKIGKRQGGRLGMRRHSHGHPQERSSLNQVKATSIAPAKAVATSAAADFPSHSRANISEVSIRFC